MSCVLAQDVTQCRCCGGLDKFSEHLEETNDETILHAIKWLKQTTALSVNSRTNVVEAIEYAIHCQNVRILVYCPHSLIGVGYRLMPCTCTHKEIVL